MDTRADITAVGLLLLLGILWGSGYALARFATTHGVPPLGYALWQSVGPAVILSAYCCFSVKQFSWRWQDLLFFLVIGLLGISIPNTNLYFSARQLPAGLLAVIVNTVPLFTYLLALLMGEERFRWLRLASVAMAIVGILLIVTQHLSMPLSPQTGWVLMALLSPLCFAITAVLIAKRQLAMPAASLAAAMMVAASLWLVPAVVATHSVYWPGPHWQLRDTAIALEIVLSSLGYVVFFALLRRAGAVYYSFVGGLVAIMGVIWGEVLFRDQFSELVLIGMMAVIVATFSISLLKR